MMSMMRVSPRLSQSKTPGPARGMIEPLEPRQLLSVTATQPLAPTVGAPGTAGPAIDLSGNFDDPTKPTVVRFTTPLGNIDVQMLDQQKPITVQNFLNYVRSGRYDPTFIHRSSKSGTGLQVIQGGGYVYPSFNHVQTDAPIVNEFNANGIVSNTRGTIAMAKTSDPNSATSEWFINVADNSTSLDSPGNSGGFTVFGNVINDTLTTVDSIAALPIFQAGSPFNEIPLRNYTQADFDARKLPDTNNLVTEPAQVLPELTFTAASSDPSVASPTVSGNKLTLAYGQATGSATITVTATDAQGQSVSGTFAAQTALPVKVGKGNAKSVSFTDADGTVTTVSLRGAGTASVNFAGTGLTSADTGGRVTVTGTGVSASDIALTGTNASTTLVVSTAGGDGTAAIGNVTSDGKVKSISAPSATLTGKLTTAGSLGRLDLGASNGASITLGGFVSDKPSTLNIGAAVDTSIASAPPVKALKVGSFTGSDVTADVLSAPAVGSITSAGGFTASVTVLGAVKSVKVGGDLSGTLAAGTVGSITVGGALTAETLTLNQAFTPGRRDLSSLKVAGAVANSTIRSTGAIGTVSAVALNGSTVYAGIDPEAATLPSTSGGFINPASIAAVKVGSFTNSNLAANSLGKLSLGTVTLANGGTAFGLAADHMALVTGTFAPAGGAFTLKKLEVPTNVQTQLPGVDLMDLRINLI